VLANQLQLYLADTFKFVFANPAVVKEHISPLRWRSVAAGNYGNKKIHPAHAG